SPVSSCSRIPLAPTWPPLVGSNWPPGGGFVGAAAGAVEDEELVVDGLVWAVAEPFSIAAPSAPPTRVEPTRAALTATFRMGFMSCLLLACRWARAVRAEDSLGPGRGSGLGRASEVAPIRAGPNGVGAAMIST